jgi:histone acetyltransferase (RNA polymerase elongator complex component)
MMTGLPGDDDDGASYTAEKIAEILPSGVRIYPTVVLRGTRLYDMWMSGEYEEHRVSDAVRVCARIVPILKKGVSPSFALA